MCAKSTIGVLAERPEGRPQATRVVRDRAIPCLLLSGGDIDQADKVHALVIEAVPPRALCAFAKTLEKLLAVVGENVVLAGHKKNLFHGRFF